MSPQDLAKAIDELIEIADSRYTKNITTLSKDLYNQLAVILKDLEVDRDGFILQNAANRRILTEVNSKVNEVFRSAFYVGVVNNYVKSINKVDALNSKYFTALDDKFNPNRIFIKNLQNDAIAQVESFILRDGLQAQVIQPLSRILNTNINSGGQYAGFLEQVKNFVVGNDQVESRALSYSRTYLNNILFQYSRAYQQSITADLKLSWYLYSGGVIDKSREFCIERTGKFWHEKEIQSWADLNWKGKDPLTTKSSIFVLLGGFSCRHQLIPVDESVVDVESIERIK